jgi:transcriptional regulator with XRE-family HTH domain
MKFGGAIKLLRKRLNITQVELAVMCNIAAASMSAIETDKKRPSRSTLKKICSALDIPESIIYILGMEVSDIPDSKREVFNTIGAAMRNLAIQIALNRIK